MYAGIQDSTAVLRDSRWTRDQITHTLVHYEEIKADHLSFTIGKDMSYFTEGVMGLLDRYHSMSMSLLKGQGHTENKS